MRKNGFTLKSKACDRERAFTLIEMLVVMALFLTLAAFVIHFGLQWWSTVTGQSSGRTVSRVHLSTITMHLIPLDFAMLFLVGVAMLAVVTAANFGVANREFRVVILEPVLFYFLLRAASL